jgi:ribosomal protein L10
MNKKLKTYKLYKVKHFLKTPPLILFFHTLNLKSVNWLEIEQNLLKLNLKYYKIQNTLTKNVIKNSVFSNISPIINGALCFIYPKNLNKFNDDFQKLSKMNKTMLILGVKLNKNLYSAPQLSNISTLNYKKNIIILNKTLKTFLKTPYQKFKN